MKQAVGALLIVGASIAAVWVTKRRRRLRSGGLTTGPPTTTARLTAGLVSHLGLSIGKERATALLASLRQPPLLTTIRVNVARASRDDVQRRLCEALPLQHSRALYAHATLPDMLCLPVTGPTPRPLLSKIVAVGRACAEALLCGADLFAPGVLGCSADLCAGDDVSVICADPALTDKETSRGAKLSITTVAASNEWMHVGNGVATLGRHDLFPLHAHTDGLGTPPRGVAVRMTARR